MKLIALFVAICMISSASICNYTFASPIEEKLSHHLPHSFLSLFYLIFPKLFDAIEKKQADEINEKSQENELTENNAENSSFPENENIEMNNSTQDTENLIEENENVIEKNNSSQDETIESNIENNSLSDSENITETSTQENESQQQYQEFDETIENNLTQDNSFPDNENITETSQENESQQEQQENNETIESNTQDNSLPENENIEMNNSPQDNENLIKENENVIEENNETIESNIENNSLSDSENITETSTQEINSTQENESQQENNETIENNSTQDNSLPENENITENSSQDSESQQQDQEFNETIENNSTQDNENIIENSTQQINSTQENESHQEQQENNETIESNIENNSLPENEENETENEIQGENLDNEYLIDWGYLVYISGDNDLYSYALNELNELLGINSSIGIAILFDGSLNGDTSLYILLNNSITIIEKNELNMGNVSTLEEFISFSQENLRAKNYAIEFWGHGNGWMGVCFDKSSSDSLDLGEIREALENKNISIIVFSACHMGCIEVAFSLRNYSKYMLASPSAMLATGLPHRAIFERAGGEVGAEEFCWIIYEEYMRYYSYASPKFGIWNLSALDDFVGQFEFFVDFVKNSSYWNARNESAINMQYVELNIFADKINFELPEIFYGNGSIYFPLPLYYSKYYSNTEFAKNTLWDEFLKSIK